MNRTGVSRRSFVGAGAGALAMGLGSRGASAEDIRLRMYWWGSQDRSKRTLAVADLFSQKNPSIKLTGETTGADYWTKLATQMVGRNIPDVFQLEPTTLPDYARRGACAPLDAYMPKTLNIEGFGKNIIDLCRVDGKVWGVGLGLNSFSMLYDTEAFAQAKIAPPTEKTTWKEFADMSVELTKALNKPNYWGAPYGARYHYAFDVWLRQRDKFIFTAEGKLGFKADDLAEFYAYWEDIRKRGGCTPADVQALDQLQIDSNALALGKSAIALAYSNQLVGYQLLSKNKLALTTFPMTEGSKSSGHYYRPALIWSVGATSKNPEAAAAFISFFVNDPKAGEVLGVERGVPMSPAIREAILPTLNDTEQLTVKYVNLLADKAIAYPPPAPKGAQEFERTVLRPVADQLAFGKLTVAEAAKQVVDSGARVL
ncbi:ABC transporter substrate-binding protein [Terrarubrum flagellatum]|uniref:ABC transporter substrate-binding protein n=1 Tax=Terrirubrum flagellatum TaxID=2895980 RepID=UPI0031450445